MKKFKFLIVFILGIGISLLSSNTVFAELNEENKSVDEIIQIAVVDEELAKKQEEIEDIVYNKNSKEIQEKGFTVLSTGMVDKSVELRIEPYNDENAEYLYSILGRDKIRVVGGEHAELISSDQDSETTEFNITSNEDTVEDAELYTENNDGDKLNLYIILVSILAISVLSGITILISKKKS